MTTEMKIVKVLTIVHFCPWCATDFEVTITSDKLPKIAAGDCHFTCPNCKLEC